MKARRQNSLDEGAPTSSPRLRLPSIDAATLDRRAVEGDGDNYQVLLDDGTRVTATLGRGVRRELAEECLREGRVVLIRWQGDAVVVLGALQTEASAVSRRDGVVTLEGDEVRLEAKHRVQLEAGATQIALSEGGKLQFLGERLTMHVAAVIKLIASKVELP